MKLLLVGTNGSVIDSTESFTLAELIEAQASIARNATVDALGIENLTQVDD